MHSKPDTFHKTLVIPFSLDRKDGPRHSWHASGHHAPFCIYFMTVKSKEGDSKGAPFASGRYAVTCLLVFVGCMRPP